MSDLIIIDEVPEAPQSTRQRDRARAELWFETVLLQRISHNPDTPIIIIFSKLHKQDDSNEH